MAAARIARKLRSYEVPHNEHATHRLDANYSQGGIASAGSAPL